MAFRKEDAALRDFVNTQLAAMKQSGDAGASCRRNGSARRWTTPNAVPEVLP